MNEIEKRFEEFLMDKKELQARMQQLEDHIEEKDNDSRNRVL